MRQSLIAIPIAFLMSITVSGQNAGDALRYSQQFTGGTARFMGMGGAFGALGADFTVLSTNPGGLGLYKSSELNITPSVHVGHSTSTYNGSTGSDSRTNFALGNAGYVYTHRLSSRENQPGFRYFQFAMGVNRLNDFNRRMAIEGPNSRNSLLDTYVEFAQGIDYRDIEENRGGQYGFDLYPAWWTYLLDIDTITNNYFSPVPNGGTMQRKIVDQWGSTNEWSFGLATNYQEVLYLGMSINIPWIRYFEETTYSETDIADTIYDFNHFNIYDRLETRGSGFNMKFGFIVRPVDFIRIGGAVHTPSWYTMRDYYDRNMESYFDNGDHYSQESPFGEYRYKLTTPMRLQGSLAFIFGKFGLISGEYEYVDYSVAKFRSDSYGYFDENNDISNGYTQGHNLKFGTEWRTGPFSFRGGYAYYSSPYRDGINDGSRTAWSGGLGFRDKSFYLDVAYVFSRSTEDYYLYGTENIAVNPVENELKDHRFLMTLGTRF